LTNSNFKSALFAAFKERIHDTMSDHLNTSFHQLRRHLVTAMLPDLIFSVIAPLLIYRLAAPHMSAVQALLCAGLAPVVRVAMSLMSRQRLNPVGILALLTIGLEIFMALVLNDTRWVLLSASLIIGVHGALLLVSLLTPRPLLLWLIENMLPRTSSNQQLLRRLLAEIPRSSWARVTAIWGCALLLECGVNSVLAMTLPVEQFLVVSSIVRYGLLGGTLLGTLLFAWIRRKNRQKVLQMSSSQVSQDVVHPPVSR
jgi:intracellular septation protein A